MRAHVSRCLELEGQVSHLSSEIMHLRAENRSLAAGLTSQLGHDASLQAMTQKLRDALVTLEQDNRVLSEQLHSRTVQGDAMGDLLHRQRYLLVREKNEADRAAAILGTHQEWILRSQPTEPLPTDQPAQPWLRHDALPPGAPTLSSAAPTLAFAPSGMPLPRVLSAQEVALAAATGGYYGAPPSVPLPVVQPPQPLLTPRIA
jgi:hypothetical protein